ncbi:MAG TPA: pseudouridine synthase [Thermoanaerobaculia bacterium]|nr:pseudouridine synthase [Thermoanaerobaculia bacterium]
MTAERLQKILARAGIASRRKVETLIEEGRVTVNGKVAALGDKADPETDHIKLDGKRIEPRIHFHYLVMNKPVSVMSTLHDPEGRPTVLDLVPEPYRKALVPVGRLDFNTEGLLLLTDDGDFAHRVAHPRHGCSKVYEVKVKDRPGPEDLEKIRRRGVVIDGRHVVPVRIEPLRVSGPREGKNSWWTVELAEGRTRQIREMFFRIGNPVQRLRRVTIGPFRDPSLRPGQVRELTEGEVEALRQAARRPRKGRREGGGAGGGGLKRPSSGGAGGRGSKRPSSGGIGGRSGLKRPSSDSAGPGGGKGSGKEKR